MELKLKEVISREPTLLVMVVGVPNVGKSALINSIHRIATSRFPGKTCFKNIVDFLSRFQFRVKAAVLLCSLSLHKSVQTIL